MKHKSIKPNSATPDVKLTFNEWQEYLKQQNNLKLKSVQK